MKSRAFIIFSLMGVLALCMCMGCSVLNSPEPAQINNGISPDKNTSLFNPQKSYSFDDVLLSVYSIPLDPAMGEPPLHENVHFITISGENLETNGNASTWTFVLKYKNNTKFITYNKYGQIITEWAHDYPGEEVFPDQIIAPRDLFQKNHDIIYKNIPDISNASSRLVLTGGNYSLTYGNQDHPVFLTFDAKTGALTSSNEQ